MKPIHSILQNITEEGVFIEALSKFLKSKKGQQMADKYGTMPIDVLCKRFEAPKMCRRLFNRLSATQRENIFKSTLRSIDVKVTVHKTGMKDYEEVLHLKKMNGELKLCPNLTKFEQKRLNKRDQWVVKRDNLGNPIIATEVVDGELRMLYDKQTGKPIYKYTPKSNGKGIAWKCNAYSEHKISKWENKHPKPTEMELKMDLFPHDLMNAWRTRRNIAVEAIRNAVAAKYYKVKDPTPELRLFEVGISHTIEGPDVQWEGECDPYVYGYPLAKYPKTSLTTVRQKMLNAINRAGDNIVALKAYDRYGNVIHYVDRNTPKLQVAA